ncbi:MAG: hypothetical protein GF411_07665 [Candidatus Lokiarchaeota archaeon]|nr:hypothetical protein [Candidatus Lokiarchaeota archaeon]
MNDDSLQQSSASIDTIVRSAPDSLLSVWFDQYFYFKRNDLRKILYNVCDTLNIEGTSSERIEQLNTCMSKQIPNKHFHKLSLNNGTVRLSGMMLSFLLSVLGISVREVQKFVVRVCGRNGHGGIKKPNMMEGEELEVFRARFAAIVNSDCWLGEDGRLQYTEADRGRIKVVFDILQMIGDIPIELVPNPVNRSVKIWLPKPLGPAFIRWGFTTGDKSIQNERLVEIVRNGSLISHRGYLEELISEDGCFEQFAGFKWSRTIVLNLGIYDTKYNLEPKLSNQDCELLLSFDKARKDMKKKCTIVSIHQLEKAIEHDFAQDVLEIVSTSRSSLLDDEVSLAEQFGIRILSYPEYITLYESGRVSVKWVAKTATKLDAIRWALLFPPNDPRKRNKVNQWLKTQRDETSIIRDHLEREGILTYGGPGVI